MENKDKLPNSAIRVSIADVLNRIFNNYEAWSAEEYGCVNPAIDVIIKIDYDERRNTLNASLTAGEGFAQKRSKKKIRCALTGKESYFLGERSLADISKTVVDIANRYHFALDYGGLEIYSLRNMRPVNPVPLTIDKLQMMETQTLNDLLSAHKFICDPNKSQTSLMNRQTISYSLRKMFEDYAAWTDKLPSKEERGHDLQLNIYHDDAGKGGFRQTPRQKLASVLLIYPWNQNIRESRRSFAEGRLVTLNDTYSKDGAIDSLMTRLRFNGDVESFIKGFSENPHLFNDESSLKQIADTAAELLKRYQFSLFYREKSIFLSYTSAEGRPSIVYTLPRSVLAGDKFAVKTSDGELLHDLMILGGLKYVEMNTLKRPKRT